MVPLSQIRPSLPLAYQLIIILLCTPCTWPPPRALPRCQPPISFLTGSPRKLTFVVFTSSSCPGPQGTPISSSAAPMRAGSPARRCPKPGTPAVATTGTCAGGSLTTAVTAVTLPGTATLKFPKFRQNFITMMKGQISDFQNMSMRACYFRENKRKNVKTGKTTHFPLISHLKTNASCWNFSSSQVKFQTSGFCLTVIRKWKGMYDNVR